MNFLNEAQAYEGEMRAFFEYLHRHPEIDAQCTQNGKCCYYTTEAEDKFTESASIFLNEAVTVQRIEL